MDMKAVSALAQETRKKILEELRRKKTHASDLARIIGIDRPTICYHLSRLESASLVSGNYVILEQHSPGRAAKIYEVNEVKYAQTLAEAEEMKKVLSTTQTE